MPRSGGGVPIKVKPTQGGSNVPSMGVGNTGKTGMQQRIPVMGGNMMNQGQSNPQMGNLPKSSFNVPMGQMPQGMGQIPPPMGQMLPTLTSYIHLLGNTTAMAIWSTLPYGVVIMMTGHKI